MDIDKELTEAENILLKKKVAPKKRTPKQVEIDKIAKIVAPRPIIKTPEFKEIEISDIKYRINWLGILRKLNIFGKKAKIISEKKVVKKGLWERYTEWWNKHFNKPKKVVIRKKKKVIKKKPVRKVITHGKTDKN